MAKKYLTGDEIKSLELEIMKNFHNYCEKHNLRYYLYAGTLIGAVRHKGFIPWDDDIDVVMPRPDYIRLQKLLETDPVSPTIKMVNADNYDLYPFPFLKLTDTRTSGIAQLMPKGYRIGVWIDVFPLDGLPGDEKKRDEHVASLQKKIRKLKRAMKKFTFSKNPVRLAKNMAALIYKPCNKKKLIKQLEKEAQTYPYEESPYIGVIAFCQGQNNVVPKAGFEDKILLPFEGEEFYAPGTYDAYLTRLFGDYMTLPPEDKRISDHSYTAWWVEE